MTTASLLVRQVRLVPVGRGMTMVPDQPVDLRIAEGVVSDVAPALSATEGDEVFDADGRWAILTLKPAGPLCLRAVRLHGRR